MRTCDEWEPVAQAVRAAIDLFSFEKMWVYIYIVPDVDAGVSVKTRSSRLGKCLTACLACGHSTRMLNVKRTWESRHLAMNDRSACPQSDLLSSPRSRT